MREELDQLKKIEGLKQARAHATDPDSSSDGGNIALQLHQMRTKFSAVTGIITRLKLKIPFCHRVLSTSSDAHK